MGKELHALEAIRYKRGQLALLDQKRLPHESIYVEIQDSDAAWHAINCMVVRGAPAIAVAAVLALAVELVKIGSSFQGEASHAASYIGKRLDFLVSSRPTAVNLADAALKLKKVVLHASARDSATAKSVFDEYVDAAEAILADDVISNKAIGEFGAKAILSGVTSKNVLSVLTHCNTGSLATAGYGTALGVIRSLHFQGNLEIVYCTETRPYNQGSRLTAYELLHDKIPAVLIADSAAASLLASGRIDAVIVGADRIAGNGDTANKIGTYSLALAASQLGIPFFIAAPVTTVDISCHSGQEVVIEERAHSELTHANGGTGPQIAAPGIGVWNPAFDVTPAKFITAIITNKGVIWQDKGSRVLDVDYFIRTINEAEQSTRAEDQSARAEVDQSAGTEVDSLARAEVDPSGRAEVDQPAGSEADHSQQAEKVFLNGKAGDHLNGFISNKKRNYLPLNEKAAREYLVNVPTLSERLGGSSEDWEIKEVGDGNLNFVYIVKGPGGSLVLKQSLPYVRCVGDSWPMTVERTYFEYRALKQEFELVPDHVPEIYHFDHPMALIAMRYLEPPHIILRKGLINGRVYPRLADHISTFISKTLFHTSLLALSTYQHKDAVAQSYGNVEMCRLTEQVIFTEPYMVASNNRWTSPQLDEDARSLREDNELKLEIAELKGKFCSLTQALLHGDLHTGSVMVTETSTKVIDPEFSFYGPSGFDIGAFIGNLALAYYSQDGHSHSAGDRDGYKRWILQSISDTWTLFERKFKSEWDKTWVTIPGDAYVPGVYDGLALRQMAQTRYLTDLFQDSLGFAGAKMIRRIVGISHVEDLESILDADRRAAAERKALKAATFLLKKRKQLTDIAQVLDFLSN